MQLAIEIYVFVRAEIRTKVLLKLR